MKIDWKNIVIPVIVAFIGWMAVTIVAHAAQIATIEEKCDRMVAIEAKLDRLIEMHINPR